MTTSQTYQTYQADSDQLVPEHDHVAREDVLTEPAADHADPDAGQMAPDADPAEPDGHQIGQQDPTSHPASSVALADDGSATAISSDTPGFTADSGDDAQEPEMADGSPGSRSLVSAAFTVPEPGTDSHAAGNSVSAAEPWHEIQAMFVDDPHASIDRAADLVADRVEALIQSVTERQRSIQSAWQADDAGTEELRVALQHYRTFWNRLEDLPDGD
jgi:hypothetical protein